MEVLKGMKTAKIVFGILSLIFCLIVMLQSCAVGIGNTLSENGEISGSAGFMTSLFLLAGGIVSIAGRKSKGGSIACIILYALGGIIGIANAGSYSDLRVWSGLCLILAVFFVISLFVQKYPEKMTREKVTVIKNTTVEESSDENQTN